MGGWEKSVITTTVKKTTGSGGDTTVVTAILQQDVCKKTENATRLALLERVLAEYTSADVILFPAGFFACGWPLRMKAEGAARKVERLLEKYNSDAIICFGIDSKDDRDQLAFAVNRTAIIAGARKFYPTKDEQGIISLADGYDAEEFGRKRFFEAKGKKFYIAVCYDCFGIRHKNIANPGADVILVLAHRFHPRRKGPSGDVDFARKGFAGASSQWGCPVFGTAVFFERPVPDNWPTGVWWKGSRESVKLFKYTDNALMPSEQAELSSKSVNAVCRVFSV